MHVAFCAFEAFPNRKGSGTRIRQVTRALAQAGARVTLITLRGDHSIGLPEGVEQRAIKLAEHNFLSRAIAFREAAGRALTALGPDVVHFRGPFEGQAAIRYARARGARAVYEVNGLPSVELRYHYPALREELGFEGRLRDLEREVLAGADAVLTQSNATARFLELRGLPRGRAHVIPNGADPTLFAPRPLDVGGPLRLLYAGTLSPWQGVHDLLHALKRAARRTDVVLEAIGPARKPWKRALAKLTRQLKVGDLVTFEDALPQDELAARIARSDVCTAPLPRDLRNRGQGCSPIKVFEYMAAARCVLATDLPCLREIVRHDDTGWLCRPSHPHRLSDAIVTLAEQPALRGRLAKSGRRWAVERATWEQRRAQVRAFYADAVVSAPAAAVAL
jgi:glycosyltransferase involved in cell wall biosynthesis